MFNSRRPTVGMLNLPSILGNLARTAVHSRTDANRSALRAAASVLDGAHPCESTPATKCPRLAISRGQRFALCLAYVNQAHHD